MATETFGYALNDLNLVRKAVNALRRVASNTAAFQQAVHDLQLLETVLHGVQRVSLRNASEGTLKDLEHCDHFCRPPLDRFLHGLKRLEPHLDHTLAPGSAAVSACSPPVWATRLEEEVRILQQSIGRGLRVIDALLSVEELKSDLAIGVPLPGEIQQVIESLQERLCTPCEVRSGRGHTYHNIQTSGNAYSHNGDNYFLNMTPAVPLNDLLKRLDRAASTHQAEQLITLVKDIKDMLPHGSGFIEEDGTADASKNTCSSIQSASQSALPFDTKQAKQFFRCFLETLSALLDAILLMLLWASPALRLRRRALARIILPPSTLLGGNITFVDALNREFSLQYQQFRYWPVVSAWLQCQFQDCPGALRISRGRFAIFKDMRSSGRGVMIPFEDWERTVGPGQRVLMSMYVGHQDPAQGHWPLRNSCPSCGFVDPHLHKTSIWTKCADCGQLFLLHDLEASRGSSTHGTHKSEQLLTCDEPDVFDCKEISAFSRVHDLQQHTPSQQPSRYHWNYSKRLALMEQDRAYNADLKLRRYAEEPYFRCDTHLFESMNVMSVKPKPTIHNSNGPVFEEEECTSLMLSIRTK